MSFKYPKNIIVGVSVIAALLAGTVLLGGYANSKPADTAKAGCCPGTGTMAAMQAETTGCTKTPCATECPKPCCAEQGCCEEPCPIPCPKPCCDEGGCCGTAGATGCPMTAVEADVQ